MVDVVDGVALHKPFSIESFTSFLLNTAYVPYHILNILRSVDYLRICQRECLLGSS